MDESVEERETKALLNIKDNYRLDYFLSKRI